jgi:hypothetical protein
MQNTIIVTDIFGRTPAVEQISAALPFQSTIFDPYQGVDMAFASEPSAYLYFSENVGVEKYSQLLREHLYQIKQPLCLIGFSVGASAIWQLSAQKHLPDAGSLIHISSALGFYSSQIRHSTEIKPQFPIQLVFPIREPSFCVQTVIQALKGNDDITLHKAAYLHGFMNSHSPNYHPQGYNCYLSTLSKCESANLIHNIDFSNEVADSTCT